MTNDPGGGGGKETVGGDWAKAGAGSINRRVEIAGMGKRKFFKLSVFIFINS